MRFLKTKLLGFVILILTIIAGVLGFAFFARFFLTIIAGIAGIAFFLLLIAAVISIVEKIAEKVKER